MITKLIFIHALSPLHAGTGQGIGIIDLPIAREKATNIPYLPGSSLKGSLRDLCEEKDLKVKVFGPETDKAELHSGSVVFSDQRLLLLPVRSLRGVFAWATSPYTLRRFKRDVEGAMGVSDLPDVAVAKDGECLIATQGSSLINDDREVYLEDFDLKASPDESIDKWAMFIGEKLFEHAQWREALKARLCVLSDNVFNFLVEQGTEITARIRLEEKTKTAAGGALWYEEALPAETILSGLLVTLKGKSAPEEVITTVNDILTQHKAIQLGGKATVGCGLCNIRLDGDGKGAAL